MTILNTKGNTQIVKSFSKDGIIYEENVLSKEDMQFLQSEFSDLKRNSNFKMEEASGTYNRSSVKINTDTKTYSVMSSDKVLDKIRKLTGDSAVVLGDYPVEMRIYGIGGTMDWHSDTILYAPAQWECVLTLNNDTDSATDIVTYRDELYTIETRPGSILLVRAGGLYHRVKPSSHGERVIIKALYVSPHSIPLY
jgi:hypothetical protein